jgi:hypothetical protein
MEEEGMVLDMEEEGMVLDMEVEDMVLGMEEEGMVLDMEEEGMVSGMEVEDMVLDMVLGIQLDTEPHRHPHFRSEQTCSSEREKQGLRTYYFFS